MYSVCTASHLVESVATTLLAVLQGPEFVDALAIAASTKRTDVVQLMLLSAPDTYMVSIFLHFVHSSL